MNASGVVLVIAGAWVLCQVLGGNALGRLGITGQQTTQQPGQGLGGAVGGAIQGAGPIIAGSGQGGGT